MKLLFSFFIIICALKANAQNYLISFAGTGGSSTVNTVKVENLTAGTTLTLNGTDILRLTGAVGINQVEYEQSSEIKIYPNPMTDNSILQIYPHEAGDAIINICDMTGKTVAQIKSYLEDYLQEFRLSGINSGFYLIIVKGSTYQYSGKLLCNGNPSGKERIEKISNNQAAAKKTINTDHKGAQTTIDMAYSAGDRLKFTGISGIYSTVMTDIPASDKTITFNFITCTDADGNNYPVVEISNGKAGPLIVMAQNLMTTRYNDGTLIPQVSDALEWSKLTIGAVCNYDNSPGIDLTYGKLYNWYAVSDIRHICPTGWHVPSYEHWTTLAVILGGVDVAGCKIKEKGITHWDYPNTGATNETGFTALPGGFRDASGPFLFMGRVTHWWSTTSNSFDYAWSRGMSANNCEIFAVNPYYKRCGYSVRCFKDAP